MGQIVDRSWWKSMYLPAVFLFRNEFILRREGNFVDV
jgi:hypothetical protein